MDPSTCVNRSRPRASTARIPTRRGPIKPTSRERRRRSRRARLPCRPSTHPSATWPSCPPGATRGLRPPIEGWGCVGWRCAGWRRVPSEDVAWHRAGSSTPWSRGVRRGGIAKVRQRTQRRDVVGYVAGCHVPPAAAGRCLTTAGVGYDRVPLPPRWADERAMCTPSVASIAVIVRIQLLLHRANATGRGERGVRSDGGDVTRARASHTWTEADAMRASSASFLRCFFITETSSTSSPL